MNEKFCDIRNEEEEIKVLLEKLSKKRHRQTYLNKYV